MPPPKPIHGKVVLTPAAHQDRVPDATKRLTILKNSGAGRTVEVIGGSEVVHAALVKKAQELAALPNSTTFNSEAEKILHGRRRTR